MDHSWTPNGLILLYIYIFHSRYNMDWIANRNCIGPNNSVIKRLRCIDFESKLYTVIFLLKKNVRILCIAKDSQFFSTKNNSVFVILPFEILTNH